MEWKQFLESTWIKLWILGLFIIVLISGCTSQIGTLTDNDFKVFNVYWYNYPPAYYNEYPYNINDWTTFCQKCSQTTFNCKVSEIKYDIIIKTDAKYVNCKSIINGKDNRPLGLSTFQQKPEVTNGFFLTGADAYFDPFKDNQITYCCGIKNTNEACKIVTLPPKCT
jgi:hypothetical protein